MQDISFYVIYPIFISAIAYWGTSGLWLLMDIFLAPKYRIKGGEIINWKLYKKTAKHVQTSKCTGFGWFSFVFSMSLLVYP